MNPLGDGSNVVGFGAADWMNNPAEWYVVGPGAFALTYAGPTGGGA